MGGGLVRVDATSGKGGYIFWQHVRMIQACVSYSWSVDKTQHDSNLMVGCTITVKHTSVSHMSHFKHN